MVIFLQFHCLVSDSTVINLAGFLEFFIFFPLILVVNVVYDNVVIMPII